MHRDHGIDKVFLGIVITLLVTGLLVFVSASLGAVGKSEDRFYSLLFSQLVLGLGGGGAAMFFFSRLRYTIWRKHAFWVLLGAVTLTALVFIPGVGMEHGGAKRWIDVGFTTFQPSEALKFAIVLYLAAWFSLFHKRIHSRLFGFIPLLALLAVAAGLLLLQPDLGTFLIAASAGTAIFLAAGARWRDVLILFLLALVLLGVMSMAKPYIRDRLSTLWKHDDLQGSGYQVKQSLIAVGSGGITGKGLGKSVQKFGYLPEAHGDSVFAVASEELGFLGSSFIVLLYASFALRGLWIASRAPDLFAGLLTTGIVVLVSAQATVNIASMLAIAPLTGVPLPFISHGGTALLLVMAETGILLNISRYRKS